MDAVEYMTKAAGIPVFGSSLISHFSEETQRQTLMTGPSEMVSRRPQQSTVDVSSVNATDTLSVFAAVLLVTTSYHTLRFRGNDVPSLCGY